MTSDKELKSLEFDKILKILSGYVFSRPAADLVLNINKKKRKTALLGGLDDW